MNQSFSSPYACFFPTKTIFIDDNKDFLKSLALKLPRINQHYEFFDNIEKAIKYIKNLSLKSEWFKEYIKNYEEEKWERKILEFNISDFHKQVYNKGRFDIITNIFVDYDMPGLSGLDFCEEMGLEQIHKVMLTGAADEKVAVEAFNKNLIQSFIKKDSKNIYKEIEAAIQQGTQRYFRRVSKVLFASFEKESNTDFLKDGCFLEFFKKFLIEKDIVEYYIIESTGSYLMVDKKGEFNLLFISPVSHLESIYNMAKDEKLPPHILQDLKSKRKLLCGYSFEKENEDLFKCWPQYIEKANSIKLKGRIYYYAYKEKVEKSSQIKCFLKVA